MKRTSKAERNHKREEFTKAALLYCSVVQQYETCHAVDSMDMREVECARKGLFAKYEELTKENE